MKTTGDQQLVKRINRSVLLRLLQTQPGLSRAQLAAQSGLTKSTVSLLVRELLEEGWLSETAATSLGQGRPSTPLAINAGTRALLGAEVAVNCIRVVGVSLAGEVLWSCEQALHDTHPTQACKLLAELVHQTHAQLCALGMQPVGLGVGLPGAVDDQTNVVRFAPNLGWREVDFLPLITLALRAAGLPELPVHVQNDADTAALSEYEFARRDDEEALIFVTCDVGVGAGIILNDRLFTGAQGMAGEIGHTILAIDGPLCSCGRHGCAEAFIGLRALQRQGLKARDVQRAGEYLGVLIQNLWTAFNPGVLVLGGPTVQMHPALLTHAQTTLQHYAQHARMPAPQVRVARYRLQASAVGAAALVLHLYLRPLHARRPSALEASGASAWDLAA